MSELPVYGVIMAGGRGERFWPQSRASRPKQLLRLMGDMTMVEQAFDRLSSVIRPENILVLANRDYVNSMRQLLTRIPQGNIIGEYYGRDTAACVAFATGMVRRRAGGEATIVVSPADHIIRDVRLFGDTLRDAVLVASESDALVALGQKIIAPNTGFGYMRFGEKAAEGAAAEFFKVDEFVEKPPLERTEKLVSEPGWWWNSGIFVWRAGAIKRALAEFAPELERLETLAAECENEFMLDAALAGETYRDAPAISIDYAVLEKSRNVVAAAAGFDWLDVGSWQSLRSQSRPSSNNNVVHGLFAQLDASDCSVVSTPGHLIAAIDVKDLIIVHTDDATLVCSASSAQRVKELVHKISQTPELGKFL